MSRDGYLLIDTGGDEAALVAEVGNYTHNVGPMWHKAVTATSAYENLNDTHGMTGEQAAPILDAAADHMYQFPGAYLPLNPSNGWGDYEGALAYLRRAAALCREHPKATLEWSV